MVQRCVVQAKHADSAQSGSVSPVRMSAALTLEQKNHNFDLQSSRSSKPFVKNHDRFYGEMGALIRKERRLLGVTQLQLARKLSLTRTSITNIEKGKQKVLAHTVSEIASFLEVPYTKLWPQSELDPRSDSSSAEQFLPFDASSEEREFFTSAIGRKYGKARPANSKKIDR
jgi:transcriptional regulator with XRE-family HTH domain